MGQVDDLPANLPMRPVFLLLIAFCARAQYAPAVPQWNRPAEPFRIIGNIYYVGASDVSAWLITTPAGHILLDTGFDETVPMIEAGVSKLGFRLGDIRLLLATHAHYDHAGGLAAVRAKTGARLLANPRDRDQFARGGRGDFAFGDRIPFPPVQADGELRDGQRIRLGGVVVTAHFTPGHTRGCTSYSTRVREGGRVYDVVFPCGLSAPGYQLVDNPRYPGIADDFELSFAKLRRLPCDVFLGGHSWDFGLEAKREAMRAGKGAEAFVDPAGYRAWLDRVEAAFRKQKKGGRGVG